MLAVQNQGTSTTSGFFTAFGITSTHRCPGWICLIPLRLRRDFSVSVSIPRPHTMDGPQQALLVGSGIWDADDLRARTFAAAVDLIDEVEFQDTPGMGLHTVQWVARFMLQYAGSPTRWGARWIQTAWLQDTDAGVFLHKAICRLLEISLCDARLQVDSLSSHEVTARLSRLELTARQIGLMSWQDGDALVRERAVRAYQNHQILVVRSDIRWTPELPPTIDFFRAPGYVVHDTEVLMLFTLSHVIATAGYLGVKGGIVTLVATSIRRAPKGGKQKGGKFLGSPENFSGS